MKSSKYGGDKARSLQQPVESCGRSIARIGFTKATGDCLET